jgi:hypothetical protein
LRRSAAHDVAAIEAWRQAEDPGLCGALPRAELRRNADYITRHPYGAPVRFDQVRRRGLRTFPYGVWHTLNEEARIVDVIAVYRVRRNQDRLEPRQES